VSYVDTHCHVDLYSHYAAVLHEAEAHKVYTIAVTNTPSVFRKMHELARGTMYVRAAIGLHPELAVEREREIAIFESVLPETRYVGEVGLDFRRATASSRDVQRRVFARVLHACASAGGKILTIHSRGAEKEVIDLVSGSSPGVAILHWFSGSTTNLERGVAAGAYFSVNHAMCDSASGRRIIEKIPRDRLLTESDGPFVSVGQNSVRPGDIGILVRRIAELRGEPSTTLQDMIFTNFREILRRVPGQPSDESGVGS